MKLAPTSVLDLPVYLDQSVLDQFLGLDAVLGEIGKLDQLAKPDHRVADRNLSFIAHGSIMPCCIGAKPAALGRNLLRCGETGPYGVRGQVS